MLALSLKNSRECFTAKRFIANVAHMASHGLYGPPPTRPCLLVLSNLSLARTLLSLVSFFFVFLSNNTATSYKDKYQR